MRNPETGREVSAAPQGNSEAVGRQIKSLLLGAAAIIIVILAGGGFALYRHAGALDGKLRALQASMNDLKARVDRGNVLTGGAGTGIVALLRAEEKREQTLTRVEQTLARIEKAASDRPPPPAIVLTADDIAALRTFFKLAAAGEPAQYKPGDKVPAGTVKPVPMEVTDRIAPGLRGASYLIDRNGALVVTVGADNVVVLVVGPA